MLERSKRHAGLRPNSHQWNISKHVFKYCSDINVGTGDGEFSQNDFPFVAKSLDVFFAVLFILVVYKTGGPLQ